MSDPVRTPAVAGTFYPADPDELREALREAFTGRRGPGRMPEPPGSDPRRIHGAVVPHAGFEFSGPIAARAYAAIAREVRPEAVLVLGVDHYGGGGAFAVSGIPWETPLGTVPVDRGLVGRLEGGTIVRDELAHAREHSIEVQLPFLQTILPGVPMAALGVRFAPYPVLRAVAARVAEAVRGRDILVLASTDFTHQEPPVTARRLDALALAQIERFDPSGLYETVVGNEISMCGIAPTTVLLEALRPEGLAATNLGWSHSGEAKPMARVVGYAAFVLEESPGDSTSGSAV